MKDIKIVSCDIDGTIEENNVGLSERTKQSIYALMENGCLFGIASGRPVYQIRNTLERWNLKYEPDFLIGFNGAQLWDKKDNTLQNYFSLSIDDIKDIIEFIKPINDLGNMSIYGDEKMIWQKEDELYWHSKNKYRGIGDIELADSLDVFTERENAKLLFRLHDVKDMPKLEKLIAENPKDNYVAYKTQADLMEFTHPLTNKGYTLTKYAEKYNISKQQIASFGDTTNDNAMLQAAGMAVCLINGSDDTKALANYITENDVNHDGWSKFVDCHILEINDKEI